MFLGKFVGNQFAQNVLPERICVAPFNCMLKNIKRLRRRKFDPVIQKQIENQKLAQALHFAQMCCPQILPNTCRGSRVYSLAQQTLRDPFENGSWSRSTVDPGSWAPGSGLVHIWPEIPMNLYGHSRASDDCVGRPLHPNPHPRCLFSSIWQLISLRRNSRASSLCSQLLP